jgi:hypothetical protein
MSMSAGEKRQAFRILRNAREAERGLFQLITDLLAGTSGDNNEHDWADTMAQLEKLESQLPVLKDLVKNIQQETKKGGR